MALEFNIFTKLQEFLQNSETQEDIQLEHKLVDLFSQMRKIEESNPIQLSPNFDERVFNCICQIKVDNPNWKERILPLILEYRPIQYGLTFAMASILAVVLISRSTGSDSQIISDSAGVVIENTSYLDKPSSVDYADSYHKRMFLEELKKDPKSIDTLTKLESYYLSTEKKGVANEIHYFIEEARR